MCTYNLCYEMALTLLPRQCGGAGSAVDEGSSMLQDVAKYCRIVSCSHTSFLPPFVHGQKSARKCRGEAVVLLHETKFRVDRMSDVYLSVYHTNLVYCQ